MNSGKKKDFLWLVVTVGMVMIKYFPELNEESLNTGKYFACGCCNFGNNLN
jgi:hypothetical protein